MEEMAACMGKMVDNMPMFHPGDGANPHLNEKGLSTESNDTSHTYL